VCASCADNRAAVADALRAAGTILVTTHVRMDADGIGSCVALCRCARAAGVACGVVFLDAVPARCAYLLGDEVAAGCDQFERLAAAADRIVVVDTCSYGQLEPVAEPLKRLREKLVVIDHHLTADDLAAVAWRDGSASSAGVMVTELLGELFWPTDPVAVELLATAILSDTGWLRFGNTDERTLRILADMMAAGVRLDEIRRRMYQSDRAARIRLMAAALGSLTLWDRDRVAVMALRRSDFAAAGATDDETENFVNEPMRIATVELSALVVAQPDGATRVSLRSRQSVDVAGLARRFGGGGHGRAAGFGMAGDVDSVVETVVATCTEALRAAGI